MLARLLFAAALALAPASVEARGIGSPGMGRQGPPGEPGQTGPSGTQGERGDKGEAGPAGPQGAKGDKGDVGASGAAGTQGPKGDVGAAGATGPVGPAGAQGQAGAKGETGAQGPVGKGLTLLCNTTVSETVIVALSAGIRTRDGVACPGVLATDLLVVIPTAGAAALQGYAIHHAFPTAANTLRVILAVPALAVAASYSIPVAVYAVNR